MTTKNAKQVSAIRNSARALQWSSREGSCAAETRRVVRDGIEAQIDEAILAVVGADGVDAFWKALAEPTARHNVVRPHALPA